MPTRASAVVRGYNRYRCIAWQDVAAPAYAQLLAEAAQRMGSCPAFYALWPLQTVQEPWTAVTSAFYAELTAQRIVHTAAGGGQWLQPDQAVYVDGVVQRYEVPLLLLSADVAVACFTAQPGKQTRI